LNPTTAYSCAISGAKLLAHARALRRFAEVPQRCRTTVRKRKGRRSSSV
jgi:hypothetical protein